MDEFKLIVAGSRGFNDAALLERTLIALSEKDFVDVSISIVSGMAKGADMLGYQFAKRHGVQCYEFPAHWDRYGRQAGYIRNSEMGKFADGLLAFWDGQSKGTNNMIEVMHRLMKPVHIIEY